jgi:hypothetical protein
MKIQGLFIHRDQRVQSKTKIDFEHHIGSQSDDISFGLEKFIKEITKETRASKIHLFYCCTCPIIKYIFYIIWGLYNFIITKENRDIVNRNTMRNNELGFFLLQISVIMISLYFLQIPIYFIIAVSSKNGFYKSVLSFEYIEEKIKRHYDIFNQQSANLKPLKRSLNKNISIFSIIFCTCAFILILAYLTSSIIGGMIVMKNFPVMEKILAYSNSVSFVLILIDWEAIIYFITVNMLLVYNQTDSFYKYFIALIENQVEIDIESIRDFYNDLYLHVKIIDQWICFFME